MYKSKSLQDLNLIDSFLFSASTENPQDAEYIEKPTKYHSKISDSG